MFNTDVNCIRGLHLWRNSSSEINDELYKGYRKGNPEGKINEIVAGLQTETSEMSCVQQPMYLTNTFFSFLCFLYSTAYDFLSSDQNNFNVSIWYNSTYKNDSGDTPIALTRVPRSVNLVFFSSAFTLVNASENLYDMIYLVL